MLVGIDHVVIATSDPDAAAEELESRLGLAATGGGRHDDLGTMNRLVWLGDAYLELVGVFNPALAGQSWLGRPVLDALEHGGGLVGWAVAVESLEETLRWVPGDSGLEGPLSGERRRPDGRIVRWHLARPGSLSPTDPFLIEHDTANAEWTPEERAARALESHPVGGRARLVGLEIESASPAVAGGRIRRLLAATVEPAGRAAARVRLGPHEVRFVATAARSPAVVDLMADVPLRTKTARIGTCEIRVRGVPVTPVADPSEDVANHV
jgi:hypothetical protein